MPLWQKAKMEREPATKVHDVETKRAMEAAGRAFLKEKNKMSPSSGIPELVEEVMNKLFVTEVDREVPPKAPVPPPHPNPLTALRSFSVLQPRIHKLSFPTFDSKEDPLPWLNHCKQIFRGQKTPITSKSGMPLFI